MTNFRDYITHQLKSSKKEVVLVLIGSILVSVASGLVAYVMKPLLDDLFISKNRAYLYIIPTIIFAIYFL